MGEIGAGIITVSDKGSRGERKDLSAIEVRKILESISIQVLRYSIIADEKGLISDEIINFTDRDKLDLVITTGGTGVSPRDVTPEATLEVIERKIPGIAEAMRLKGLEITPHAMISRAVAGIRGTSLIINLPGSPKAAREGLEVVLPALRHIIEKIKGDSSECAVS
jgi:molybdenum cofactor synthesis domain-containing protein